MSRTACLLVLALAAGCDSAPEPDPPPPVALDVVTRTLGRGADLAAAFGAPGSLEARAFALYGDLVASDFSDRAGRIAREIAARCPHAVGLHEVLTTRTQYPSDGAATPATRVTLDYLATLLDSLDARGLTYRIAAEQELMDAELAAARTGGARFDVRLTERAVVLVADTLEARAGPSARWSGVPFPDADGLTDPVGYASAQLVVDGRTVTVAAARFDADDERARTQARALASALGTGPAVTLATLAPPGTATTRAALAGAGFADAWDQAGEGSGLTCCFTAGLRQDEADLESRADGVWTLGGRARTVDVFGVAPSARTPGGLWPSSRAGVFARLVLGEPVLI